MNYFVALFAVLLTPFGLHHKRHHHRRHRHRPMSSALASWYNDSGTTASGLHFPYGFASLLFGSEWGRRVRFCYSTCVTGRLDDHGPYVTGRIFDLNWSLKNAIGCPDLCEVRWRML